MSASAKLIFVDGLPERLLDEAPDRGCYSATIELANGDRFKVEYFDPVRLSQEVEAFLRQGSSFAYAGVVVIPEVTLTNMEDSLERLVKIGFFAELAKLPNGSRSS